jgi:hypothetical protein
MATFITILAAARGDWSTIGPWIVGSVITALVVVWVGVFAAEWLRRRRPEGTVRQSSLFDQLCHAHGLSVETQQQLAQVARMHAHGDVVLPFLDPRILEAAVRKTPELDEVGRNLFGDAWQSPLTATPT